jgi:hypothetical protein
MSVAIGLVFVGLSITIFLVTFLPLLRKQTGMIYLLVFRTFAALLFFIAYSAIVVPSTVTYGAYNAIQGSTVIQYPNVTVTTAIPSGTQSAIGGGTIAMILLMIGSVGIDYSMRMREK